MVGPTSPPFIKPGASCGLWRAFLWAVAPGPENLHTFDMTLKNAAFLAFVGMALATALLPFELIENVLNVVRGLIPAVRVFSSLIFTFAAFCVAVFFFVFQRAQR